MNVLIIGGTKFLGRHIVEAALEQEHHITLFHRGKTNPGLFQGVETILGDRENEEDLQKLADREWDAVIDTCGYHPSTVAKSLDVLSHAAKYLFISTISVYKDLTAKDGLTEEGETLTLSAEEIARAEESEGFVPQNYGPLKRHCEMKVLKKNDEKNVIVRPGLIVGPHDPTDRFTYWPSRVADGGEVLAPGRENQRIQFIDVRDLAQWIIHLSGTEQSGIYHANGPEYRLTMERFLDTCAKTLNKEASFTWVSEDFLQKESVKPWMDLPVWIPTEKDFSQDVSKAIGSGLSFRPIEETIADTYQWDVGRGEGKRKAGITKDREKALLEAWKGK